MRYRLAVSRVLMLIGLWLSGMGACQAAVFHLAYDDFADGVIGTSSIVGTGVFSFTGAANVGTFALSSLSDLSFSASFGSFSFSTAGIQPYYLQNSGISIFDRGNGELGLVFVSAPAGPSLDIFNGPGRLSHEPTLIGSSIGCCGGDGQTNLYFFSPDDRIQYFGDYSATTASAVPTPTSLALVVLGLLGLTNAKRRTVSCFI